jgi:hypothetical protein
MKGLIMNTKHTAGPWHVGMKPGPIIYGPNGEQVADLRGERKTTVIELDEAVANTKLIAAAPELLETLQDLVKAWDYKMGAKAVQLRIDLARAAIAKVVQA